MQLRLNSPQLKRSGSQQKPELQLKSVAVGVGAEGEACLAAEATKAEEACLADEAKAASETCFAAGAKAAEEVRLAAEANCG